ncbi:FAD binding domain-containing protein [Algicella marina]|uniref:FAD binding domain-containing protein n=1 Tax=Algicella marina TaxID=2683284 RepID=UPI0024DFB6C7|nr:xanthine dehydrogenase family protein subunit M [Algicella marina]
MEYFVPENLGEALNALSAGPMDILAGGTDYYPGLAGQPAGRSILDISRLPELNGVRRTAEHGWRIGACTRWRDIARAGLPPAFDGLAEAALTVGSVQIQNTGTIAGNVCNASPAADGVPPLLTLDAEVEIRSAGSERVLPLSEFITGPREVALAEGEMVTALIVPSQANSLKSAFEKLGARRYLVISIAMVAVAARVEDGRLRDLRIAVGACSPVARRLTGLERALAGTAVADLSGLEVVTGRHLDALTPLDDIRGTGKYRLSAVPELVTRSVKRLIEEPVVLADG